MLNNLFTARGKAGKTVGLSRGLAKNFYTGLINLTRPMFINNRVITITNNSLYGHIYTIKSRFNYLLQSYFSAISTVPTITTTRILFINNCNCGGCCEATSHTGKLKPSA